MKPEEIANMHKR
jgi:hypothetical protein